MKNKKILICISIIIIIILLIIGIIFLKKTSQDDTVEPTPSQETTYNTNAGIINDKNIDNILFTNIKCSFDGSNSLITYTITNQTTETINLMEYEIIIKDKDNNILAIIAPSLNQELTPNSSFETGNSIDVDLTTATNMELNLISR